VRNMNAAENHAVRERVKEVSGVANNRAKVLLWAGLEKGRGVGLIGRAKNSCVLCDMAQNIFAI